MTIAKLISLTTSFIIGITTVVVVSERAGIAQGINMDKAQEDQILQQCRENGRNNQHETAIQSCSEALKAFRQLSARNGESRALNNIGFAYYSLGNNPTAIEHFEKALLIARELKNRQVEKIAIGNLRNAYRSAGNHSKVIEYEEQILVIVQDLREPVLEGISFTNLGIAYDALSNYPKAIEYHEKSLAIARKVKDQEWEGRALNHIGGAYSDLGDKQQALYFLKQALVIRQAIGDRDGEANTLSNIGAVYDHLGEKQQALQFLNQALPLFRTVGDRSGEASALNNLNNIGAVYSDLGDKQQALQFYNHALLLLREVGNHRQEANTITNIGSVYSALGDKQQASQFYNRALPMLRKLNDRVGEARTLNNIGSNYHDLGDTQQASQFYSQALQLYQAIGYPSGEAATLNNMASLGNVRGDFGRVYSVDVQQRLKLYKEALPLWRKVGDRRGEANTLTNIGRLVSSEIAIGFLKQSVNLYESLRKDIRSMPKETQESFKQEVAGTYRDLADLLLKADRIIEAQQVLDLLKVQDLQDFLKDLKGNERTTQGIELFPQESAILTAFNNRSIDVNSFFQSSMVQTQVESLKSNAANQNLQLNAYKDLQVRIKKLGKNVALFYPLILDDRLELVILTTDGPPIHKPVAISKKQLSTEIEDFRKRLQGRDPLITQPAQTLYNRFIQPIESELKAANVDTIVYAPDDIMRYVPLAALHDGKQWLAQRYQINYLTALALTDLEPDKNKDPRVVAAALTEKRDVKLLDKTYSFDALNFTQPEVENLAKILPTQTLINQAFNRPNLTNALPSSTIIHLATHGLFVPNNPEQSVILLGDGTTINLREIEQQWKFPNASLVVLSACETAIGGKLGNGIEILGFGYQMQRIGSRASISSLWSIDDGGTQGFMNSFYTALKQNKTPAVAIQQTQLDFINGKITQKTLEELRGPDRGFRRRIEGGIPTDLTHPYYWAPFILIGNGL